MAAATTKTLLSTSYRLYTVSSLSVFPIGTIQKHHFHLVDIQDANGTVSLTKLWNLLATAESNVVQVIPNSFLYEYSEDKYVTVSSDMELRNAIDAAQAYGGSILTLFGSDK